MNLLRVKTDDENVSVFPVKNISLIFYNKELDHTIICLKDGRAVTMSGRYIEQTIKTITSLTNGKVGNLGE